MRGGAEALEGGGDKGEGQGIGYHQTRIAQRIDAANGARPAQLVAKQLAEAFLGAGMADKEPGDGHP